MKAQIAVIQRIVQVGDHHVVDVNRIDENCRIVAGQSHAPIVGKDRDCDEKGGLPVDGRIGRTGNFQKDRLGQIPFGKGRIRLALARLKTFTRLFGELPDNRIGSRGFLRKARVVLQGLRDQVAIRADNERPLKVELVPKIGNQFVFKKVPVHGTLKRAECSVPLGQSRLIDRNELLVRLQSARKPTFVALQCLPVSFGPGQKGNKRERRGRQHNEQCGKAENPDPDALAGGAAVHHRRT